MLFGEIQQTAFLAKDDLISRKVASAGQTVCLLVLYADVHRSTRERPELEGFRHDLQRAAIVKQNSRG